MISRQNLKFSPKITIFILLYDDFFAVLFFGYFLLDAITKSLEMLILKKRVAMSRFASARHDMED